MEDSEREASKPVAVALDRLTISAMPNPFNSSVTVTVEIPTDGHVTMSVYNLTGLVVRALVRDEAMNQGVPSMPWDGRDDRGIPVASGLHIFRANTRDYAAHNRIVLIR